MRERFSCNNFDLVRLLAAINIMVIHMLYHCDYGLVGAWVMRLCYWFPGVPIFFFVSGFLISRSFQNCASIRQYVINRILRLYPALVVCTGVTVISEFSTKLLMTFYECRFDLLKTLLHMLFS